jgi:hypothetical protein
MVDVSIEVQSPLQECFLDCEIYCERECCGIDAFATDPELIANWGRAVGPYRVTEAQRQLTTIIAVVEDRSHNVSISFLNHYTCDEAARHELLQFLEVFRTGLAAIE